jgi:glycine oxidase
VQKGPDVIVVGGGIIGCAVAFELSRRGARVRVIEARAIGAGATRASAGVLAPYIESHNRGLLLDLTVRSLALYDDFVANVRRDSGLDIEFRRCGTLEIATDATTALTLQQSQRQHDDAGVEMAWLPPAELRRIEPAMPDSVAGAAFVPRHGYVRAEQLTEALLWAAMRHGADVESSRTVTDIQPHATGLTVVSDDGTSWDAERVVIAAGAWSGGKGMLDGALDVRPVRGQLLRLVWRSRALSHVIWGPDCYLVPWVDGTVLVGATSEDVGFDDRTTAAGVRDLLDAACELIPEAWRATFVEARSGLRPATSDGLPIMGPSATVPGLFYATGHYRNGILLAPFTALAVADLVLDDRADGLLDRLRPGRRR